LSDFGTRGRGGGGGKELNGSAVFLEVVKKEDLKKKCPEGHGEYKTSPGAVKEQRVTDFWGGRPREKSPPLAT